MKKGRFLCVKNMFRRFIVFISLAIFFDVSATRAATASVAQTFNFGSFVQTSPNASLTIDYNANVTSISGLSTSSIPLAGSILYVSEATFANADVLNVLQASDTSLTATDCSILISNITPSSTTATMGREGNWLGYPTSHQVYFGASVTISGFCKEGTYTGTISVPYTSTHEHLNDTTNIPVSITINDKISIIQKQDLNFGTMMAPSSDSTITLAYNGTKSTTGGVYLLNNSSFTNGIFTIEGQSGRTVNMSLPKEILIYNNNGNSLIVNNFSSDTGVSFVLNSNTIDANIGATLHIPAHADVGDYTGTYTVLVSY